jgi:hypothetical protein
VLLNLGVVTARCADGAAEARRRAAVCDSYTSQMRTYRTRLAAWVDGGSQGPAPIPPHRAAWWVEEG